MILLANIERSLDTASRSLRYWLVCGVWV